MSNPNEIPNGYQTVSHKSLNDSLPKETNSRFLIENKENINNEELVESSSIAKFHNFNNNNNYNALFENKEKNEFVKKFETQNEHLNPLKQQREKQNQILSNNINNNNNYKNEKQEKQENQEPQQQAAAATSADQEPKRNSINFLKKPNSLENLNNQAYEETEGTLTLATFEDRQTRLNNEANNPTKNISNTFIFPLLGVTCFISMNAFIASQDCFDFFQPDFHSESFFNNIFFFANTLVQIVLCCVNINLKTWSLLKLSLIVPCVSLILFTFFISYFNSLLNFIFCCFLIFVTGAFSGLYLYVINGILPFIEFKNLILVITGQALSSVLISLIRIITFFAFANLEKSQIFFFSLLATFAFALIMVLLTFILLYFLKGRHDFYSCFYKLDRKHRTGIFDSAVLLSSNNVETEFDREKVEIMLQTKKSQFQLLVFTLCKNKLFFVNVIFFAFATYLFHPVIFIKMSLFSENGQLSVILTIIFFNVFDSLGRISTNFFFVKSKKRLYLLNLLRIYFVIVFVLIKIWIANDNSEISEDNFLQNAKSFFTNQIFILVNIAVFSFTYGFINCNSFILLGGIKDQIIQFKSNMITSICIGGGIFVGSSLSNVLGYLLQ